MTVWLVDCLGKPVRILLVDDNKEMVQSLRALLEPEGHVIRGLYSAVSIAADCQAFAPDVVIMDIEMPGRSGWDAAQQIRTLCHAKPVTLIALSGEYSRGVDSGWVKASGFDYFLAKPADPQVLKQLVRANAQPVKG